MEWDAPLSCLLVASVFWEGVEGRGTPRYEILLKYVDIPSLWSITNAEFLPIIRVCWVQGACNSINLGCFVPGTLGETDSCRFFVWVKMGYQSPLAHVKSSILLYDRILIVMNDGLEKNDLYKLGTCLCKFEKTMWSKNKVYVKFQLQQSETTSTRGCYFNRLPSKHKVWLMWWLVRSR